MRKIICRAACFATLFNFAGSATAQVKSVPFGDMEHWLVRQVDESGIIGGKTKFVYEVAEGDTLKGNVPFVQNLNTSPWGTSSILAVVKGITKSSTTVFPELHQGHRLGPRKETPNETLNVMANYSNSQQAPVRDTKNPMAKLIMGVEFRDKPKSLIYDYYFQQGQNGGQRIKEPGFGRTVEVEGINCGEVCMMLQKRWEDAEGNVYAKRVGTIWERYSKSTGGWRNATEVPVHYGDITKTDYYKPFMALQDGGEGTWHCMNSKGKVVPIVEVGWGEPDDVPTHIILRFSSGHGGAYVGCPGAMMHIDNVKMRY